MPTYDAAAEDWQVLSGALIAPFFMHALYQNHGPRTRGGLS